MKNNNSTGLIGLLLASLVVPVGIALWVVLWNYGFMASLVAFAMAFGAVGLFRLATKRTPTRGEALGLLAIVLVGVVLAFIGGMVSDGWQAWSQEFGSSASFYGADFWSFIVDNLTSADIWEAYTTDLLIALVFAVLGAGGMVKELFTPGTGVKTDEK